MFLLTRIPWEIGPNFSAAGYSPFYRDIQELCRCNQMHNVSSDGTQMNGMCNKSNMFILHVKDNFQFILMSNSFLGCSLVVCYKAICFTILTIFSPSNLKFHRLSISSGTFNQNDLSFRNIVFVMNKDEILLARR